MPRIKNFKINTSSKVFQIRKRKATQGGIRL